MNCKVWKHCPIMSEIGQPEGKTQEDYVVMTKTDQETLDVWDLEGRSMTEEMRASQEVTG